jgi:uncharacterized protein (DUF1499 family)
VSSQADASDRIHYIEPISFPEKPNDVMRIMREAVQAMPRATIVREEGSYLHAEFRTRWLRFVDDVELAWDERAGVVQVRSASRLGRRDFGVNRARVEALRALIRARA